jgi:hypothetical protein
MLLLLFGAVRRADGSLADRRDVSMTYLGKVQMDQFAPFVTIPSKNDLKA